MTKFEWRMESHWLKVHPAVVIRHLAWIRHSNFVIRHSTPKCAAGLSPLLPLLYAALMLSNGLPGRSWCERRDTDERTWNGKETLPMAKPRRRRKVGSKKRKARRDRRKR